MPKRRRDDGDDEALTAALAHDAFFCALLSRVPRDIVVPPAEDLEAWRASKGNKFRKHAKVSAAGKKALALKAKRRRFDTALTESLSEAQARMEAEETAEGRRRLGITEETSEEAKDGADAAAGEDLETFLTEEAGTDAVQLSSIVQLQLKLREKIRKQRVDREGKGKAQLRRTKKEEAIAAAEAAGTVRPKPKPKARGDKKQATVGSATRNATVGDADAAAGADGEASGPAPAAPAPAAAEVPGLDFGEIIVPKGPKKLVLDDGGNKGSKIRELRKMLAAAEQKERRLGALGKTEEGALEAEKLKWADALRDAKGDRVKDNAKLLRKALKSRERKKAKSAKSWDVRIKSQEKQQKDAQDKRTSNLQKRKRGQSTVAVPEKPVKRGRRGAGFEGRKSDFLNGGGKGAGKAGGGQAGAAKGGGAKAGRRKE